MELNEKDLELIAKIDERLKQLGLITDNKYPDEEPNPEVIKFYDRYFKKADNEQQAPVEWKVGEWAWSEISKTTLSLITSFEDKLALVNNQNGLIECWDIDLMVKPTKEEIEQHLVKIAGNKYPVGTRFKNAAGFTGVEIGITDGDFFYSKESNALYTVDKPNKVSQCVWYNGVWAEPITEQKERWQPAYGCKYWYIGIDDGNIFISDFHWGNDDVDFIYHDTANCFKTQEEAERAAQEIRKTLENL